MSYRLLILRRAQKELEQLPWESLERVHKAVQALQREPRPTGCTKLSGRMGWRIRAGNYRVIYDIDDDQQLVTVLHIGHRRDVYR